MPQETPETSNQLAHQRPPKPIHRTDPSHVNPEVSLAAKVKIWQDTCKTIRYGIVTLGLVLATGLIVWGVVACIAEPTPLWKVLLFSAVPPTSLLGGLRVLSKKRASKAIAKMSDRNRKLESRVDPDRESSELDNNGNHRHDE